MPEKRLVLTRQDTEKMADRYVAITVEYGTSEHDEDGNLSFIELGSDTFETSDSTGAFVDLYDDVAFEARNSLPE